MAGTGVTVMRVVGCLCWGPVSEAEEEVGGVGPPLPRACPSGFLLPGDPDRGWFMGLAVTQELGVWGPFTLCLFI